MQKCTHVCHSATAQAGHLCMCFAPFPPSAVFPTARTTVAPPPLSSPPLPKPPPNTPTGVWRIKAINDAGGWESDTVVEDMDLSLRVYLRGWRSIYLHDVKCPNELPSTLSAYKTQQFRWLSGPMQIVRKSFANIWRSR